MADHDNRYEDLDLENPENDPHFYDFMPGYATEMDYMNALEADDYTHELDDLMGDE